MENSVSISFYVGLGIGLFCRLSIIYVSSVGGSNCTFVSDSYLCLSFFYFVIVVNGFSILLIIRSMSKIEYH